MLLIWKLLLVLQAFGSFINDNPKSPEFISLFIDENLKKGLKEVSLQFINNVLCSQLQFSKRLIHIYLIENGRRSR